MATFVLATVALGLFGISRRSSAADLVMAVQLLGTGGTAILLLLAVATATPSVIDVALMLALLAAFAAVGFVRGASALEQRKAMAGDGPRS